MRNFSGGLCTKGAPKHLSLIHIFTSLTLRLNGVSKKRARLYEDYAEGLLDEAEYSFAKKSYDEQYANLSRRLDEAVQRCV